MAKQRAHHPRIRRGDIVAVISGADKTKRGRVLRLLVDQDRVVVEGVNIVHKHVKRSQKHPQGGRVRREAPVHISNVMLVDPNEDRPTKVGKVLADASKGSRGWVRVARASGKKIDEGAGKPAKPAKKGKKAKE